MSYSVDDKLKYNRQKEKKTPFDYGYIFGVKDYRSYPKSGEVSKKRKEIKDEMDHNANLARTGDPNKASTQYCKGYMCAVRDCSKERKSKKK